MKKHNFEQAIEIFKGMFEGWVVVTKDGSKFDFRGMHYSREYVYNDGFLHEISNISHLEQTLPMNGDEVWAGVVNKENGCKATYIGKTNDCEYVCEDAAGGIYTSKFVELISPTRKLTISEATDLLKRGEKVDEPFEIVKE